MLSNLEIDRLCDEFESAWQAGRLPRVEDFLLRVDEGDRAKLLAAIIPLDVTYHRERDAVVRAEDYSILGEEAVAIARREIKVDDKQHPGSDDVVLGEQASVETSSPAAATQE